MWGVKKRGQKGGRGAKREGQGMAEGREEEWRSRGSRAEGKRG